MSEYARLVIAVDSLQAQMAERDLRGLESQSDRTGSAAVGMAKKIGAAFAGLKLAQQAKDAVVLASRYDQMGLVLNTVGENTGRSAAELGALDQALQDTGISALQSRNNLIRMMSANIDLSQATDLARLAQNAAVVANINSSEAFERLIKGIQSAEKETLETMGLNVNFAQSYEKLAVQLGKNADNLTTVEKVQAGVNAAMEAGNNIAGTYDASMDNAGKRLASASRHLENFQIKLGSSAQTEFGYAVDAYSESLKFLGENAGTVAQVIETSLYASIGLGTTALVNKTRASIASAVASRAQAAGELQLAQAQVSTTAATLQRYGTTWQLTGGTRGLTAAVAAHEAAERRLAAAQLASAGVGRTLLGVMGGPLGLAVTAGAVALSFIDWSGSADDASRSAADLSGSLDGLIAKWQGLGDAQRVVVQGQIQESLRLADEEAQKSIRSVETAFYERGNVDNLPFNQWIAPLREFRAEAERGGQSIYIASQILLDGVPAQSAFRVATEKAAGEIEGQAQKSAKATAALRALESQTHRNVDANNSLAATETDLAGQKWLSSLQRQADFAGQLTELQKVNIAIEKGYAGTLSETDQALARNNAALIDKANAVKTTTKAVDTLTQSYKSTEASLARQVYLFDLTGEAAALAYELEHGELKKLDPTRKSHLEDLARELDAKEALKKTSDEMLARDQDRMAMAERLASRQAEIDIDAQSVGMGDREIEEMRALSEVRQRFAQERLELTRQQNDKDRALSREAFQARMDDLREFEAQEIVLVEEGARKKAEAQAQWQNGAKRAWDNYLDSATDVAGMTEQVVTSGFNGMEDAIVQFATTGKASFADFANAVIADMARIAARQAATGLLNMGISAVAGWAGGAASAGSTAAGYTGSDYSNWLVTQAKGGAWDGGVQKFARGGAFTNGVVSSPTLFPTGLMGEAGPEAIMPLHRGSDGSLGVKASGGPGGGSVVQISVPVTITVPPPEGGSELDADALTAGLEREIKAVAAAEIAKSWRPGGHSWRQTRGRA